MDAILCAFTQWQIGLCLILRDPVKIVALALNEMNSSDHSVLLVGLERTV
jgi:hypothetical protein